MSTLTVADVERIAALAHLELTDEEKQLFTRQLADILNYAEQLQAIDTTGVPATAHVNARAPRLRSGQAGLLASSARTSRARRCRRKTHWRTRRTARRTPACSACRG